MRREADAAARCRFALAVLLVGPAVTMADSKPAPFELDAIVFKENGRFHEEVVAECEIEQKLRESVTKSNKELRRKRSPNSELRHLTLRIDKVTHLGSEGVVGTELGVTAILAGQSTGQLFLCRDHANFAALYKMTHCQRVSHCAKRIADDVAGWVGKLKDSH